MWGAGRFSAHFFSRLSRVEHQNRLQATQGLRFIFRGGGSGKRRMCLQRRTDSLSLEDPTGSWPPSRRFDLTPSTTQSTWLNVWSDICSKLSNRRGASVRTKGSPGQKLTGAALRERLRGGRRDQKNIRTTLRGNSPRTSSPHKQIAVYSSTRKRVNLLYQIWL